MVPRQRLVAALAPPHALQQRLRWSFLGICLLCLAGYVPMVALGSRHGGLARAGACLAIVVLGWWWVAGYRRGRFPLPGLVLETVACVSVVLVLPDPVRAVTLAYFAVMYRALDLRRRRTAAVVAVLATTFLGASLLAPALGSVDHASVVLAAYPGVPVVAAVMALTFASAARADRAVARERLVSRTGLTIARAHDEETVRSASRAAVLTLLAGTPGASARLLPAGRHPAPPAGATCLDIPVPVGDGDDRVLRVVSDAPIPGELHAALSTLAGQLAVALARSALTQDLARRATQDHLTGLANRRHLDETLRAAFQQRRRHGELAVLALDLDGFKAVNDTFGHGVGDDLLVAVAGRLLAEVRDGDLVARSGGDEFLVVLSGTGVGGRASRVAERLVASIGRPFVVGGRELAVGVSIGAAVDAGGSARGLLEAADRAMYRAKGAGRGRVAIAHEPSADVLAATGRS